MRKGDYMPNKATLKRYLIKAIITSLALSALVGIFVILLGTFGEVEARILLTTLAVGTFSITGLANLRNVESDKQNYRSFAWFGIASSMLAMFLSLILIWTFSGDSDYAPWRSTLVFMVLAVSTAHASLLLPLRGRSATVTNAANTTLICIAIVASFLIYLILGSDYDIGEFFYRLLAVAIILDVLGTIVTPILAKFADKPAPPTKPTDSPTKGTA